MTAKFTILVIDDDPSVSDILQRAAKETFPQARFLGLTDFEQALAYISELMGAGPQLVLLDLDLAGGRNGLDLLTLLRHHPQGAVLPIVVLSNQLTKATLSEAYRRGANAVTPKEVDFNHWKDYVQQLRLFWFETATIPRLYFAGAETSPKHKSSQFTDQEIPPG